MLGQIAFQLLPVLVVDANLLAVGTHRKQSAQLFDVGERLFELRQPPRHAFLQRHQPHPASACVASRRLTGSSSAMRICTSCPSVTGANSRERAELGRKILAILRLFPPGCTARTCAPCTKPCTGRTPFELAISRGKTT